MGGGVQLHHLFLVVSDLKRSRAFYTDALGLKVNFEDGHYIQLQGQDGFHIGMEEGDATRVGGPGIQINARVDDVDQFYEELLAKGLSFSQPPANMEWGARHAFLEDPDGYALSIFTPTGGDRPSPKRSTSDRI